MVVVHTIPIRDVQIIYTVCPAIAILFTLLRVWMRARTARLWWDDALAFLAACFIGITCAGGWMHFEAASLASRTTKISAYYMLALSFYGGIWCARLSILYNIIRIAASPSMRNFLHCLAAAMLVAWAVLFAQIFWVCVPMPHWTLLPAPQCPLPLQVAVVQLVSDILADGVLIAVPVRLFLLSHLNTSTKSRLVIIFSASIMTTIVSIVHAYYLLKAGGVDVLIAAIVEVAVSVIVCNLSVVVTAISRMCRQNKTYDEDSEDRDVSDIRTFGSWSVRPRKRHVDSTIIALAETRITVQKESETYIDMGHATESSKGRLEMGKDQVLFYEPHHQAEPQKAYLPAAEGFWR